MSCRCFRSDGDLIECGECTAKRVLREEGAASVRVVRVGVGAIVHRGDAILMGRRKGGNGDGTWAFPGGHMELGESAEMTGSRELHEETGIAIPPERFRIVPAFIADGEYVHLYVAGRTAWGNEPRVVEPDRQYDWTWVTQWPSPLFAPIQAFIQRWPGEAGRILNLP